MAMVPSFRKARAALLESLEEAKAKEKRLLEYDSPSRETYFLDDITEAPFPVYDGAAFGSPVKRMKWTAPKSIDVPPTDSVAPSPAPVMPEGRAMLASHTRFLTKHPVRLASNTRRVRNRVPCDTMFDTRFSCCAFHDDGDDDDDDDDEGSSYVHHKNSDDDGHSCFSYESLPIKHHDDITGNQASPRSDGTDPHRGSAEPGAATKSELNELQRAMDVSGGNEAPLEEPTVLTTPFRTPVKAPEAPYDDLISPQALPDANLVRKSSKPYGATPSRRPELSWSPFEFTENGDSQLLSLNEYFEDKPEGKVSRKETKLELVEHDRFRTIGEMQSPEELMTVTNCLSQFKWDGLPDCQRHPTRPQALHLARILNPLLEALKLPVDPLLLGFARLCWTSS
jgi:hypothetical protein